MEAHFASLVDSYKPTRSDAVRTSGAVLLKAFPVTRERTWRKCCWRPWTRNQQLTRTATRPKKTDGYCFINEAKIGYFAANPRDANQSSSFEETRASDGRALAPQRVVFVGAWRIDCVEEGRDKDFVLLVVSLYSGMISLFVCF